eukprot:tig00000178_g12811.t1
MAALTFLYEATKAEIAFTACVAMGSGFAAPAVAVPAALLVNFAIDKARDKMLPNDSTKCSKQSLLTIERLIKKLREAGIACDAEGDADVDGAAALPRQVMDRLGALGKAVEVVLRSRASLQTFVLQSAETLEEIVGIDAPNPQDRRDSEEAAGAPARQRRRGEAGALNVEPAPSTAGPEGRACKARLRRAIVAASAQFTRMRRAFRGRGRERQRSESAAGVGDQLQEHDDPEPSAHRAPPPSPRESPGEPWVGDAEQEAAAAAAGQVNGRRKKKANRVLKRKTPVVICNLYRVDAPGPEEAGAAPAPPPQPAPAPAPQPQPQPQPLSEKMRGPAENIVKLAREAGVPGAEGLQVDGLDVPGARKLLGGLLDRSAASNDPALWERARLADAAFFKAGAGEAKAAKPGGKSAAANSGKRCMADTGSDPAQQMQTLNVLSTFIGEEWHQFCVEHGLEDWKPAPTGSYARLWATRLQTLKAPCEDPMNSLHLLCDDQDVMKRRYGDLRFVGLLFKKMRHLSRASPFARPKALSEEEVLACLADLFGASHDEATFKEACEEVKAAAASLGIELPADLLTIDAGGPAPVAAGPAPAAA